MSPAVHPGNAPRIYVDTLLKPQLCLKLSGSAARHIQVLRMQPGEHVTLFNGRGGEWLATITAMGRSHVDVTLIAHAGIEREAPTAVTLLVAIPANERMDFLLEKATELGAAAIYPLMFERSVVRLDAVRSAKKQMHWQAVVIAACEQCGRNLLPVIYPVMTLAQLLQDTSILPPDRRLLSLHQARPWPAAASLPSQPICVLSGPEGGLTAAEELQLTQAAQFIPYSLGSRTLRADTAPLVALSTLTLVT